MSEMKTIKAIHIDAFNKKIAAVQIVPNLDTYYKLLRCNLITSGYKFPDGDVLFVDDEGLFKDPKHFFRIPGIDYDFAGNGLIVGTDPDGYGEEADVRMDVRFFGVVFREVIPTPAGNG